MMLAYLGEGNYFNLLKIQIIQLKKDNKELSTFFK